MMSSSPLLPVWELQRGVQRLGPGVIHLQLPETMEDLRGQRCSLCRAWRVVRSADPAEDDEDEELDQRK